MAITPIILSTWSFGKKANAAAWPRLEGRAGCSLDAVETACREIEADAENMTVGLGGYPDRSGQTTLDASIMLSPSRCGAVCYVRRFVHPVSIARLVMDNSPHVMLAGEGADRFAAGHGMTAADPTTDASRAAWRKWSAEHPPACRDDASPLPPKNIELGNEAERSENLPHNRFHDTIGVLAQDAAGQLAGACSSSGWAFKLPGRVGDSPIVGHGLYVDPHHGAAVATGSGELIMGVCGGFLAVELLRQGASPQDAAVGVLERIIDAYRLEENHQAAIIVLAASGEWSSAALRPGYKTALRTPLRDELVEPHRVMLPEGS